MLLRSPFNFLEFPSALAPQKVSRLLFRTQGILNLEYLSRLHILKGFLTSAAAASLQSCSTLCNPIDGSPPGSPVPGILQARTLEWVSISFSNA